MPTTPMLHLGAPTSVGPLTVFPVWTDAPLPRRPVRTGVPRRAAVGERAEGSQVPVLTVENPTPTPFVVTGGTVLGGWQTRVLVHRVLVDAMASLDVDVDVRCVEQGRWGGGRSNRVHRARAPLAVRGAPRGVGDDPMSHVRPGAADQCDVWACVARYESALVPSATSSLVEVAGSVAAAAEGLVRTVEPLPGQRGVLVGVGGHPALLEVLEHPAGLRDMVADAGLVPPRPTPGRRARAFAAQASGRPVEPVAAAGAGRRCTVRDDLVDIDGVVAEAERILHLSVLNVRHELIGAS